MRKLRFNYDFVKGIGFYIGYESYIHRGKADANYKRTSIGILLPFIMIDLRYEGHVPIEKVVEL